MQTEQKITQLLAQRAAELKENLKSGDRSDRAALDAWLRDSKLHVEAYLDITALDRQVDALDDSYRPDIESVLAAAGAKVHELRASTPSGTRTINRERSVWMLAAAIAGVAFLVVVAIVSHIGFSSSGQSYTTAAGERHTVTLPDGSTIEMNVDTSLRVEFDRQRRNIELRSGEAVFKVAHDTARPFIVRTPTAAIRALGTQFNVYQRQTTVVSVLEGRVQVTTAHAEVPSAGTPEPDTRTNLAAGEEAKIEPGKIEKREHPDVSKTVAWREDRLYVDDMPLEEIVREFNRHGGPVRIRLEGIPAGAFHFGGNFNVTDPVSLADILEHQQELTVERRLGEILIRAKPGGRRRRS
jgi:transmembrane sensor